MKEIKVVVALEELMKATEKTFFVDGKCPRCKKEPNSCYCSFEDLGVQEVSRNDFIVKQSYDEEPTKTLICRCGSDKFLVGTGDWFTAVKCTECGFEKCVHTG